MEESKDHYSNLDLSGAEEQFIEAKQESQQLLYAPSLP